MPDRNTLTVSFVSSWVKVNIFQTVYKNIAALNATSVKKICYLQH